MKQAVIKSGGKQYLIEEGQKVILEKTKDKKGKIKFAPLLMYTDGKTSIVDPKKLKTSQVDGEVLDIIKEKKIRITKFKAKKGYHKTQGHRQKKMIVQIDKIKK